MLKRLRTSLSCLTPALWLLAALAAAAAVERICYLPAFGGVVLLLVGIVLGWWLRSRFADPAPCDDRIRSGKAALATEPPSASTEIVLSEPGRGAGARGRSESYIAYAREVCRLLATAVEAAAAAPEITQAEFGPVRDAYLRARRVLGPSPWGFPWEVTNELSISEFNRVFEAWRLAEAMISAVAELRQEEGLRETPSAGNWVM